MSFLPPFLLGFLALSFQIFLLREFSVHFYGNEVAFGFVLGSWLLWGGLGSVAASKLKLHALQFPLFYYAVCFFFPLCLVGLRLSRFALHILPGETSGTFPMFISSLLVSFLTSFPLGILFVFNALFQKGDVFKVYILESLGSAAAGVIVYLFLIPLFSNWEGAAIASGAVSFLAFFSFGERKKRMLILFVFLSLIVFSALDFPSQKLYWSPFRLVQSKDSPYGKLQVIQTEEQTSLYNNSLLVYSYPNLAASEESVHFALLQNPHAVSVLLIGGGAGGGLRQVLKYPLTEVDYVELDPENIRFSLQFLPEEEKRILSNERVHIHYLDGRAFLKRTSKKYEMIILNLPEPATAQINRFYTKEFFLEAKEKLTEKGVFSFRIPSAENYISFELENFLSSLFHTLREVFPFVEVAPGATNIFLASSRPLSIEFEALSRKIKELGLNNSYVSPALLFSRLSPWRVELIRQKVSQGKKKINLDFSPISYFYNSVLWSTQFRGLESRMFSFFSRLSSFWLLDVPLLLFVLLLTFLLLKGKKSIFFLTPLAVMGFTTIVAEIIVIISFQSAYGYIYNRIALLLASFMVGLFVGSFFGKRQKRIFPSQMLIIQSGFMLLMLAASLFLKTHPPQVFYFLFLLLLGFLGGDLFIISNHLFLKEKTNYGIGYGLDLLGSFLGAAASSSLLIPLVGLPLLLKYLFLINSFCFLFIFVGLRKK